MKRLAFAAVLILAAGCAHKANSQVPPTPPVFNCQTPVFQTGQTGPYVPLNQATPATASPYVDTPPPGVYCYVAQGTDGTQVASPSPVAGPFTVASGQSVQLSWANGGPLMILSRAPAVQAPVPTTPAISGVVK